MSKKNPGGFISSTVVRTPDPTDETQYSGVWSMPEQYQASKAGDWANPSGQTYQIPGSLRFNNANYLTRSFASAGNRKRFTLSVWMKKSEMANQRGNQGAIIDYYTDNNNRSTIFWGDNTKEYLALYSVGSSSVNCYLANDTSFRDFSAWYHLVVSIDTTLPGADDRVKFYINGKIIPNIWSTKTPPSQNTELMFNSACDVAIGGQRYNGSVGDYYYNGYMADLHVIDGQGLSPDYFGYYDYNNIWQPKQYTGGHGLNGFYLKLGETYNCFYSAAASGAGEFFNHTRNNLGTNGGVYRRPGNDSAAYWNGTKITGDFDIYWKYGVGSGSVSPGDAYIIGVIDASYKNSFNYDNTALGGTASTVFYTQYGSSGFYTRSFINGSSGDALASGTNPGTTSYVRMSRVGSTIYIHQGTTPGTWTLIKTFGETFSGDVYFFFGSGNKDQAVYIDPVVLHVINGQTDAHFITSADGIGGDSSGSLNPFQSIEVFSGDQMKESPTDGSTVEDTGLGGQVPGNYAILNQLASVGTYSNGGLQWTGQSSGDNCAISTIGVNSGKWYWEVQPASLSNLGTNGVIYDPSRSDLTTTGGYTSPNGFAMDWSANPPLLKHSGTSTSYGTAITSLTDTVMVALDLDNQKLYFGLNGTWFGSSNPATGTNAAVTSLATGKTWFAHVGDQWGSASSQWKINFGQTPFKYTAPSGFKCLSTVNLPESAVSNPSEHFNTVLWSGNGSTQSITEVGFQPDLVWTKDRGANYDHTLFDTVRGVGDFLRSNSTSEEETRTDSLTSFDSDGFSVGADSVRNNINKSGAAYVSWIWKAGGTTSTSSPYMRDGVEFTPTHGTLTPSSISVNTKSGFSIVTYTGSGAPSSGVTIAHSIGTTPGFIITKKLSTGTTDFGWSCWHKDIGGNYGIWLHLDNARNSNMWGGYTNINTNLFSPADLDYNNVSGQSYVNYLFAEKEGFSKIGSFVGNSDNDGPYIYCGFKPAYVLLKANAAGYAWYITDKNRPGYNANTYRSEANSYYAEYTNDVQLDYLSNGFKLKTGNSNYSGTVYYVAFAEHPFKRARAR